MWKTFFKGCLRSNFLLYNHSFAWKLMKKYIWKSSCFIFKYIFSSISRWTRGCRAKILESHPLKFVKNFQEGFGSNILPFHFWTWIRELFLFKSLIYKPQKSFWSKKTAIIDHRVAWRGPFRHFNIISEIWWQEQPNEGASNPPKVGATHRR